MTSVPKCSVQVHTKDGVIDSKQTSSAAYSHLLWPTCIHCQWQRPWDLVSAWQDENTFTKLLTNTVHKQISTLSKHLWQKIQACKKQKKIHCVMRAVGPLSLINNGVDIIMNAQMIFKHANNRPDSMRGRGGGGGQKNIHPQIL